MMVRKILRYVVLVAAITVALSGCSNEIESALEEEKATYEPVTEAGQVY